MQSLGRILSPLRGVVSTVRRTPSFFRPSSSRSASTNQTMASDTLFIAVVASENHPGLKHLPPEISISRGGTTPSTTNTSNKTVKFSLIDSDLKFQNQEFTLEKVNSLLYIPPGDLETLGRVWENVNVPWMHCFL